MLEIRTEKNNDELIVYLAGRLDIATAPDLESKVIPELDGVSNVTLDMKDLTYISSAGLRIFKMMTRKFDSSNNIKAINVSDDVYVILEVTGFTRLITVSK